MSVTNAAVKKEEAAASLHNSSPSLDAIELHAQQTYRPPGNPPPLSGGGGQQQLPHGHEIKEWVRNTDGTLLIDHKGRPITVDRMLATKPLRGELSTRPGPGNRKLTYLSGEGVTRTLNDIFGFDGWNLDIQKTQREECVRDDKGRFHVAYTATVRLTHRKSGAYKEDCGAGDSIDKSLGTAVANALKASITDAMKRAARHFGDKLGNSLYQGNFSINSAPSTLKDALDQYDIQRAKTKFGFPKDQAAVTARSNAELVASTGVTIDSIPEGVCGPPGKQPTNPKAPVPPFHSSSASAANVNGVATASAAKAINPQVSQTPSVYSTAVAAKREPATANLHLSKTPGVASSSKPVVSADRSVRAQQVQQQQKQPTPPFAGRERPSQPATSQPPPTATQGLQSSSLFQLSQFTAGNNTTQTGSMPTTAHADENIPPASIDLDATLAKERPSTSTGNKPPPIGALVGAASSGAGTKRSLDATSAESAQQHISQVRKAPNLNPYLSS